MDQQTQKKLLETVKRNYEEIADDYNITRQRHLMPLWARLVEFAKEVKEGAEVLDVGCGNGRLLDAFEGKKINYIGIDANEILIRHAINNYAGKVPDARFFAGNVLELSGAAEVKEKFFDNIFSIAVLHHLPGEDLQAKALEQMKGRLKPGGQLFITVWNMWGQKKYRKALWLNVLKKILGKNKMDCGDILFDWKGNVKSRRYYHAFLKSELKALAEKAGLKVENLYKDKANLYLVASKK